MIIFGLESALQDALIAAWLGVLAVAAGGAARGGALMCRRMVTRYDARAALGDS